MGTVIEVELESANRLPIMEKRNRYTDSQFIEVIVDWIVRENPRNEEGRIGLTDSGARRTKSAYALAQAGPTMTRQEVRRRTTRTEQGA